MKEDYVLRDISLGKVASGDNKDKTFLSGRMRRKKFPKSRSTAFTTFEDDQDLGWIVTAVKAEFPEALGGTNKTITKDQWETDKTIAQKAMKNLMNYTDEYGDVIDLLTYPYGSVETHAFPTPMVMTYSQSLNGHNKGDMVMKQGSSIYWRIWYEIDVFVEYDGDGPDAQYLQGFKPEDAMRNAMRRRKSIMDLLYPDGKTLSEEALSHIDPVDRNTLRKMGINLPMPTDGTATLPDDAPVGDDQDRSGE